MTINHPTGAERGNSPLPSMGSNTKYRRLFETAQDGILLLNALTGVIEDANPFLIELLGFSLEELQGKQLWEIGAFADVVECKRLYAELIEFRYVRYEDLPLKAKTGLAIEVEFVSNVYDVDGIDVIQCNIRDITDRKRIEAKLAATERMFRGLVEHSISGIYIIQDDLIVYVNQRAADILNQGSIIGMIGTGYLLWVNSDDRTNVAGIMAQILGGSSENMAYEFYADIQTDGQTIRVGANASLADHLDRPAIVGMIQDISEKRRLEDALQHYINELKTSFMSTVKVATIISEMRDPYTAGHERRVSEIASAIGTAMGFDKERVSGLRVAGHLHDLGKILIPAEILSKPGRLTSIEYELIKGHVQASYDVLAGVEFPWPIAQIALQHHERMDGSGYPNHLKGDEILLDARIMAIADVVESMASHRPYRAALGIDAALSEIKRGRGTIYDAVVADACVSLFTDQHFQLPV